MSTTETSATQAADDLDVALREAVAVVADRVRRYQGQSINEQNTKSALINPILKALGWDVEDPDEVYGEFRRSSADNPVDYALLLNRRPCLFLEAKSLRETLDDRKWALQILSYAMAAGVEWVVLSNGDEYRIYNSHAAVPVEEKLFRRVSLSAEQDKSVATLRFLSKSAAAQGLLDRLWQEETVDQRVSVLVQGLFSPEPDADFARFLAQRIQVVRYQDVLASLSRLRVHFDPQEPQSKAGLPEAIPAPEAEVSMSQLTAGVSGAEGLRSDTGISLQKQAQRITLGELIGAGILKPPQTIEAEYKGRTFTAIVEGPSQIRLNGHSFGTVSAAGSAVLENVLGPRKDGKAWSVNGWILWSTRDSDNRPIFLDELRRRLAVSRMG